VEKHDLQTVEQVNPIMAYVEYEQRQNYRHKYNLSSDPGHESWEKTLINIFGTTDQFSYVSHSIVRAINKFLFIKELHSHCGGKNVH
jgi:hypothetical protein